MKGTPFALAQAMIRMVAELVGQGVDESSAWNMVGGYRSRGHGRGKYSGKKRPNVCTNWSAIPHFQKNGAREVARRQRQIACGMLKVSA